MSEKENDFLEVKPGETAEESNAGTNDPSEKDNEYEDICYICRRPESVAGRMIKRRVISVSARIVCSVPLIA